MEMAIEEAKRLRYTLVSHNKQSRVVSFLKHTQGMGKVKINVYYTTRTVGTCIEHPKQGKTQLFRENINTRELLKLIFTNPRAHTDKGYKRRKNKKNRAASAPVDAKIDKKLHIGRPDSGERYNWVWWTADGSEVYIEYTKFRDEMEIYDECCQGPPPGNFEWQPYWCCGYQEGYYYFDAGGFWDAMWNWKHEGTTRVLDWDAGLKRLEETMK
mmetsp:Transcript_10068/g.18319  ORF Transcript_10068/g.18319 Transcript_10068/m.18319 type:complete len:213 (-) Transcript_10068:94-732(-)